MLLSFTEQSSSISDFLTNTYKMELIFLLISIILTLLSTYTIGRTVNTHEQLIRAYKTSEELLIIHVFLGIISACVIFVTLCATNNTIWHLSYLFN